MSNLEPSAEMRFYAAGQWAMYQAYLRAGFDPGQAIFLCGMNVLAASLQTAD